LVLESGLQSVTKQLGVTLTGATRGGRATFRAGYTFTRARDQSSFSCCAASRGFASPTTAGDPNVLDWGTSTLERRHAFVGTVSRRRLPPLAARPHRRAQLVHRPLATVARPPAQLAAAVAVRRPPLHPLAGDD